MVTLSIDAATGQRSHEPDIWVRRPAAGVWRMEIDLGPGHLPRTDSRQQALAEEDYPALAEVWDNDDDAIFDSL